MHPDTLWQWEFSDKIGLNIRNMRQNGGGDMEVQKEVLISFLHVVYCFCLWSEIRFWFVHTGIWNYSTILRGNFCSFLMNELMLVRFLGVLAHTRYHFSPEMSMGFRSGLWDCHSTTFTQLSLSHFVTTSEVCLQSLSCWKAPFTTKFYLSDRWGYWGLEVYFIISLSI